MAKVIKIPESLAHELDQLAEAAHKWRNAYVVDVLWRNVMRNKQRQGLKLSSGAWTADRHPEGGAAYVDKIRSEPR
jgi:predicted transcriptional regulator